MIAKSSGSCTIVLERWHSVVWASQRQEKKTRSWKVVFFLEEARTTSLIDGKAILHGKCRASIDHFASSEARAGFVAGMCRKLCCQANAANFSCPVETLNHQCGNKKIKNRRMPCMQLRVSSVVVSSDMTSPLRQYTHSLAKTQRKKKALLS